MAHLFTNDGGETVYEAKPRPDSAGYWDLTNRDTGEALTLTDRDLNLDGLNSSSPWKRVPDDSNGTAETTPEAGVDGYREALAEAHTEIDQLRHQLGTLSEESVPAATYASLEENYGALEATAESFAARLSLIDAADRDVKHDGGGWYTVSLRFKGKDEVGRAFGKDEVGDGEPDNPPEGDTPDAEA